MENFDLWLAHFDPQARHKIWHFVKQTGTFFHLLLALGIMTVEQSATQLRADSTHHIISQSQYAI